MGTSLPPSETCGLPLQSPSLYSILDHYMPMGQLVAHQVRNTPLISPDGPINGTSGEMTGIRRAGIGLFVAQIVSWRTPGAGDVRFSRF